MIQLRSVLNVADNSGAKLSQSHSRPWWFSSRFGFVGDIVTAAVEGAETNGTVKDKQVIKAVIVRSRKETRRDDGTYVRFDDNAVVIIDSIAGKQPLGYSYLWTYCS